MDENKIEAVSPQLKGLHSISCCEDPDYIPDLDAAGNDWSKVMLQRKDPISISHAKKFERLLNRTCDFV